MRMWAILILALAAYQFSESQEKTRVWKGYLTDQMCAYRWRGDLAESYAKRHALSCNFHEACRASGFGIMVKGTYIKLAESSNAKALEYLRSISKKKEIFVSVLGTRVEDTIEVTQIETAEIPEDDTR